eukprot:418605_1
MSGFLQQPDALIHAQLMFFVNDDIQTLTACRVLCTRMNCLISNCHDILDYLRHDLLQMTENWYAKSVTDMYLKPLLHENILKLDLSESPFITNKGLQYIAQRCENIECITLYRGTDQLRINYQMRDLTDDGIHSLVSGCAKLTEIHVAWCTSLTCKSTILIASSRFAGNITSLDLQATGVDQEAIDLIGKNCTSLVYLHLKDAWMDDVSALKNCTNMQTLHLCRTGVKPSSVLEAVRGFATSIQYLCVMGVRQFDMENACKIAKLTKNNIKTWACLRGTSVSMADLYDQDHDHPLCVLQNSNVVLDDPH